MLLAPVSTLNTVGSTEIRGSLVFSKAKLLNIQVAGDAHNNDATVMFNNVIWPWKCYSNNFYFEQPLKHLFMVSVMPLRTSLIKNCATLAKGTRFRAYIFFRQKMDNLAYFVANSSH